MQRFVPYWEQRFTECHSKLEIGMHFFVVSPYWKQIFVPASDMASSAGSTIYSGPSDNGILECCAFSLK